LDYIQVDGSRFKAQGTRQTQLKKTNPLCCLAPQALCLKPLAPAKPPNSDPRAGESSAGP
jgi:hypothetical protein